MDCEAGAPDPRKTRVADDQIPCRVFDLHSSGFKVEIQRGASVMWLAYTPAD